MEHLLRRPAILWDPQLDAHQLDLCMGVEGREDRSASLSWEKHPILWSGWRLPLRLARWRDRPMPTRRSTTFGHWGCLPGHSTYPVYDIRVIAIIAYKQACEDPLISWRNDALSHQAGRGGNWKLYRRCARSWELISMALRGNIVRFQYLLDNATGCYSWTDMLMAC